MSVSEKKSGGGCLGGNPRASKSPQNPTLNELKRGKQFCVGTMTDGQVSSCKKKGALANKKGPGPVDTLRVAVVHARRSPRHCALQSGMQIEILSAWRKLPPPHVVPPTPKRNVFNGGICLNGHFSKANYLCVVPPGFPAKKEDATKGGGGKAAAGNYIHTHIYTYIHPELAFFVFVIKRLVFFKKHTF